ncbi:protein phosphatase methylesterase 1 [Condylostylus longicornis]|uniref:protein phosphatase methylesterase 1 n=1 Tax=Condylostylus longicornis TaxID=2530218 RepID=UPI00244E2534|nr:protein phosphatase methylesterase 1 [Condylostylus longicornis]
MSHLQRSIMKSRLPPSGAMPGRVSKFDPSLRRGSKSKDYKPKMWDEFFAEKDDIAVDEKNTFRIYKTKTPEKSGPVLLMLHGGGYCGLTWSYLSQEITQMLHCQCLCVDLRGHGDSITDNDEDLSAETLATDVGKLVSVLFPDQCPPIYLIGHSMGGAIAVHVANMELIPGLIGVTVIDVVEGTALEALASMQSFLRSRPKYFKSITNAIEWCVRSGQVRNLDSAKISMPGQIINCVTKKLATNELPLPDDYFEDTSKPTLFKSPLSIDENEETDFSNEEPPAKFKIPNSASNTEIDDNKKYTWRIDLSKSEIYWKGWFEGLSEKFLNIRVTKQLILASIDGLDKALTVGQMQGKFQMQVLAKCGHAVQEDRPHELAEVIGSYLVRNKYAEAANEFVGPMPSC